MLKTTLVAPVKIALMIDLRVTIARPRLLRKYYVTRDIHDHVRLEGQE